MTLTDASQDARHVVADGQPRNRVRDPGTRLVARSQVSRAARTLRRSVSTWLAAIDRNPPQRLVAGHHDRSGSLGAQGTGVETGARTGSDRKLVKSVIAHLLSLRSDPFRTRDRFVDLSAALQGTNARLLDEIATELGIKWLN
jgi:hypothetical protein